MDPQGDQGDVHLAAAGKETAVKEAWAKVKGLEATVHQGEDLGAVSQAMTKTNHVAGATHTPAVASSQVPVIQMWNIAELGPEASKNIQACIKCMGQELAHAPGFAMACVTGPSQPDFGNTSHKESSLQQGHVRKHWETWMDECAKPEYELGPLKPYLRCKIAQFHYTGTSYVTCKYSHESTTIHMHERPWEHCHGCPLSNHGFLQVQVAAAN